jgi:hypothetical protein
LLWPSRRKRLLRVGCRRSKILKPRILCGRFVDEPADSGSQRHDRFVVFFAIVGEALLTILYN